MGYKGGVTRAGWGEWGLTYPWEARHAEGHTTLVFRGTSGNQRLDQTTCWCHYSLTAALSFNLGDIRAQVIWKDIHFLIKLRVSMTSNSIIFERNYLFAQKSPNTDYRPTPWWPHPKRCRPERLLFPPYLNDLSYPMECLVFWNTYQMLIGEERDESATQILVHKFIWFQFE